MTGIHIRYGDFHVVLDPANLRKMPRTNFRKLLKLAFRDPRNSAALEKLKKVLLDEVTGADAAHKQAQKEFTNGWRLVGKSDRSKAAVELRRENNRLHNAVKRTKAELNSAEAFLKIYNEMETIYYGSNYSE